MSRLRLGVIGAGSWVAASHLPNLARRRGEVDFVAVCRKGKPQLERLRDDWGFRVASEDYLDVLEAKPDIVVVASPAALHAEHTEAALRAGAHVLVEKPFCLLEADAWRLVRLADQQGRHLVISLGYNYKAAVRRARQLITEGLGQPVYEYVTIHMASVARSLLTNQGAYAKASNAIVPEQSTWTDPALAGGGYGQAQLSHALGLAFWLTGMEVQEVAGALVGPPGSVIELYAAILCRLAGEGIAVVSGAAALDGVNADRDRLEISGFAEAGQFRLSLHENQFSYLVRGEPEQQVGFADADCAYSCEGPVEALVDLALGREVENCSPGWLGAQTVSVLEQLYRQAGMQP